jgi:hypothetical protein
MKCQKEKRKNIIVKLKLYTFYGGKLYKLGPIAILKQCLTTKVKSILITLHKRLVGGHFGVNTLWEIKSIVTRLLCN